MRTLFIVVSLFFVLSFIPVHSLNSNASTSENNLFIKNNESLLNNSQITLILAIDNSNSQNNSKGVFNSRKKSIENFVNIISNFHNKNIEIGLVVWNTKPIQKLSLLPSTKFDIINEHIESINTYGNTCLGVGLQAAKKMIDEIDNKDEKYIIYISDGIEQYCNNSIEVCSLAKDIRDSQITIYAIGKRDPKGNLSCITDSKNSFDLNQVSFDYALKEIANNILNLNNSIINNVYASDPIESDQKEALISINSIPDRFGLKAEVNNITITQLATNVTVSKTMKEGDRGPKIEIKISTPKPRYMDKDFLFSIDSSGSVGLEKYNLEINNSMRKVLAYLNNRDKGERINVSLLSWDGDVDFAYGNLNNGNNTTRARFISVKQTEKDFPSLMRNFTCIETEPTLFNVGLNEAFKILKNDPNKKYPNNIRALFFITGKGEFQPWTPDENFDDKIPRFALGVGVEKTSLMNDSLFNISSLGEDGYRRASSGTVEYSFPLFIKKLLGGEGSKDLGDHMIELLDIAINSSILYNLSISDNINPFLEIDPDSIRVNDRRDGFRKSINKTNITIELNNTLNPGSEVKITYDTRMNLTLPLSEMLNEKIISQKFLGKDESGTLVEYNWHDGNRYGVKMPTNYIHIFS